MIQRYGMSDNIGQMAFPKDENALVPDRVYSEVTAQAMDEEAKAIVDQVRTRALWQLLGPRTHAPSLALALHRD